MCEYCIHDTVCIYMYIQTHYDVSISFYGVGDDVLIHTSSMRIRYWFSYTVVL